MQVLEDFIRVILIEAAR